MQRTPTKKIILVLNKIDLVPKENVEAWLKYLRNELPTIAFKCSTQEKHISQQNISFDVATKNLMNASECLGADTLLQLLKNYCRNINIKTAISVGIIGYPNVGKSSLINSLKRSKAVGVGATPGFTKSLQEVHLDKNIKLIDCPGIVFASSDADQNIILRNAVKLEQVADPIEPVELILKRCKKEQILQHYMIPNFHNVTEFLVAIAQKRGKLKKGGVPNLEAAAITILRDWNSGSIPFCTIPPKVQNVHISASIISDWSKVLDIKSVINEENSIIAGLSAKMNNVLTLESSEPTTTVDKQLIEDDDQMEDADNEEKEQEESSEEDAMSDVSYSTATVATQKSKKQNLKDPQDQLNPQINKERKQQLKKQKKKEKKRSKREKERIEEEEDYNFDEFWKDDDSDIELKDI